MSKKHDCCEDLEAILAAWDQLVLDTNAATTQAEIEEAYMVFDIKAEEIAVKNGHPAGKPRRRP